MLVRLDPAGLPFIGGALAVAAVPAVGSGSGGLSSCWRRSSFFFVIPSSRRPVPMTWWRLPTVACSWPDH
jgi:hypothetical protein